MKHEVIKRGRITYYLTDNSVLVDVGGQQWVSYNIYNSPSRSSLGEFKKRLKASKPDEYGTVIDQMDLAQKCKLVGTGTRKPAWIE